MSFKIYGPDGKSKRIKQKKTLQKVGDGNTNFALCPKCDSDAELGNIYAEVTVQSPPKITGFIATGTDGPFRCGNCGEKLYLKQKRNLLEYLKGENPTTYTVTRRKFGRKRPLGFTERGLIQSGK